MSDAQLSEHSERFEKHSRSLLLEFFVLRDGEVRNIFPSFPVGGVLASGPPDLSTVFIKIVKRVTVYKPHFGLRDRFTEVMCNVPVLWGRSLREPDNSLN
jgi:hypothetical protein